MVTAYYPVIQVLNRFRAISPRHFPAMITVPIGEVAASVAYAVGLAIRMTNKKSG